MNRMKNRYIAALLTFVFVFLICLPLFTVNAADTITIKTTDDYLELAKNCKTDTWSEDKTVVLENDIDLSDINFVPIPTFSGVFMGNGHTISGVDINSKGSHQGLFRYIQKDGRIENLTVEGTITPLGTRKFIGGIAGELRGIITNCTFNGTVSGDSSVGGICGYITDSGQIISSYSYGNITGKSYTGGICGQNYGAVELCENYADVNTTDNEEEKTIQDISNIDLSAIGKTESINTNTDTGGICGYLKGKIKDCKNSGNIGYRSIGYNTGGICGRSAGYIVNCENKGIINGRKDIGGICGQAEPYVMLEYSDSVLEDIKNTLNNIKDTVNSGNGSHNIDDVLGDITDRVALISDDVTAYANDITAETNNMLDRIHYALQESESVFTNMSDGIDHMAAGLSDFKQAGDEINTAINELNNSPGMDDQTKSTALEAIRHLKASSKQLSRALANLQECIDILIDGKKQLNTAIDNLENALVGRTDIENAFTNVANSLDTIINAFISAGNSISDITEILEELKNQGYIDNISNNAIDDLKALSQKINEVKKALVQVRDAVLFLGDNASIRYMRDSFYYFSDAFLNLSIAFGEIHDVVERLDNSLEFGDANDALERAINSLKDGCTDFESGANSLSTVSDELNRIIQNISEGDTITLPSVSESFSDNIDGLENSIDNMRNEISSLKDNVADNINNMTDQLSLLSDIISDAYTDSLDNDKEDYYEDISDYDISGNTKGRIEKSNNRASVFGDVNVGGIVGSMAIEYDFDPEDDIPKSGDKSIKFTYKTKCIVRHCTNDAEITSKKNYSGGICGRMDLGSILSCDNYGKVISKDGGYIGGIAGKSDTIIRNSASKCTLSGNDYVGGIAGQASKIVNCQTLVHIEKSDEFSGAIAGDADTDNLSNNYCINDDLGAIDDINYTGIAEPGTIDRFVAFVDNNFNKDVFFTLRFFADDEKVAELTYSYKASIPDNEIPVVPEKKGYYGKWSDYNFKEVTYDADITAEYNRNMDIIASDAKRDNEKSVILVCGTFDDRASVSATAVDDSDAIDSYDVKISGVYTENYTVRYLPKSDKKSDIYINGEKVSSKAYGRYLEFKTDTPVFRLSEKEKNNTVLYICIALGIILIFTVIAIVATKKGRLFRRCIK